MSEQVEPVVCIAHGTFVPCRHSGEHRLTGNPYWVKAVRDYQGSSVRGLTWEPAWERPTPTEREAGEVAAVLANALHEADDSVDMRYCRHVAEVQAAALAPLIAEREAAAKAEALRSPYDDDGYCEGCGNGSWKAHAPNCGWADLRDAKAEAWDEGYDAGSDDEAADWRGHELTGHPNPYRAAPEDRP